MTEEKTFKDEILAQQKRIEEIANKGKITSEKTLYEECRAKFQFGNDFLEWKIKDIDDFNDYIMMCKLIINIKNKNKKIDIKKILD